MMWDLERVLPAFAVAQTIICSIRSGSRALYLLKGGPLGVMDGPLILPPPANATERSDLWDISTAFRHGVQLALDSEKYDDAYEIYLGKEPPPSETEYMWDDGTFSVDDSEDDDVIEGAIDVLIHKGDIKPRQRAPPGLQLLFGGVAFIIKGLARAALGTLMGSQDFMKHAGRNIPESDEDIYNLDLSDREMAYFSKALTVDDCALPSLPRRYQPTATNNEPRFARITAYAPECFADLRKHFGITQDAFHRSILSSGPFVSFQSNSKGATRAGLTFFFTRDGAYMIKTIKRGEVQTLLDMLPKYYHFMKRHGRLSLLTRFCGIYDIGLRDGINGEEDETHTFVVMNAVFPPESPQFISERYDLKGSTAGRECSLEERKSKGSAAVLKDLDLLRENELFKSFEKKNGLGRTSRNFCGNVLRLGRGDQRNLVSQLRKDVGLLENLNVIDYSLLVGVVIKGSQEVELNQEERRMSKPSRRRTQRSAMEQLGSLLRVLAEPRFVSRPSSLVLPYYASDENVVDGGKLARVNGRRRDEKAIFYFGLIDFLQPFDYKKNIEWKMKGMLYDEGTYSCVPPGEYADRFLDFIDHQFRSRQDYLYHRP